MLAANGAAVIINNHENPAQLEEIAEGIRNRGGEARAVIANVARREEAQKLAEAALTFGSIDILVMIAGGLVKRVPMANLMKVIIRLFWM